MAARFINIDRQSPMLMPPDIRDWLPENHIARFIVQLVKQFSVSCNFWINWKGSGSAQYPPSMLATLLVYCYATGRFSSRRIEEATYSDVAVRFITGDTHPDHDTTCVFRRRNKASFQKLFVDVLALAGRSGLVKQVGGISKIKANASKHAAVSYKHAGELIRQLTVEVEELTQKAEEADGGPEAYVASRKGKHGKTVADLEKKDDPPPPPEDAPILEKVKHRMSTKKGKALYRLRKQTVEPVFGIIKQAMGFRQFHLRGHPKVELEWNLVCLAYNFRRLFNISGGGSLLQNAMNSAKNT